MGVMHDFVFRAGGVVGCLSCMISVGEGFMVLVLLGWESAWDNIVMRRVYHEKCVWMCRECVRQRQMQRRR